MGQLEKNDIVNYIERLKQIEQDLSMGEIEDMSFMNELNDLLNKLSSEFKEQEYNTSSDLIVKVKRLHKDAVIPSYSKDGDAGMDLTIVDIKNADAESVTFGFGIAMEIPKGYVGLVFPRSSVRNYQLSLSNSVGVIDCVPSGTKIKTVNGDINVEELFNNMDLPILSYNEELNTIENDIITDMWIVENKELLKITTEDNDIIEIPYEKEVFTKSGWKKAINLTENDEILRYN